MAYQVSERARRQARELGLAGNVEAIIARMARYAAPFTHDAGNRRFEGYVLEVVGREVRSLAALAPGAPAAGRRRRAVVYADSVDCGICGGTRLVPVSEEVEGGGRVTVMRPCPRGQDPARAACDQ